MIAIRKLLADGKWHDREKVLDVGRRAVPPGIAHRRAEAHRLDSLNIRNTGERRFQERTYGDDYSAIRAGKQRVTNDALRRMVREQTIERKDDKYRIVQRSSPQRGKTRQ